MTDAPQSEFKPVALFGALSVRGKILLSVFAVILIFTMWGAFTVSRFRQTVDLHREMVEVYAFNVHHANRLLIALLEADAAFLRRRTLDGASDGQLIRSKIEGVREEIDALKKSESDPSERELLARVEKNFRIYSSLVYAGPWMQTDPVLNALKNDINSFRAINVSQLEEDERRLDRFYRGSLNLGVLALCACLLITLAVSQVLMTALLHPIRRLMDWVLRVRESPDREPERAPAMRSDEFGFLAESFSDLATRLAAEREAFRQQTITDELTGLYNYRYFQNFLKRQISNMSRHRRSLALAIVDIDHFKHYNDVNGFQAGNQALKDIGALLKSQIREEDFVARFGGEEFVMVFPETNKPEAMKLCERIRETVLASEFTGEKNQPQGAMTISIGVAFYPDSSDVPKVLVEKADKALYEAKRRGRNCVVADGFHVARVPR